MLKKIRRDTAGFILSCFFVGLLVLDAAMCVYLHLTFGWVTSAFVGLVSVQVLLLAFLWSLHYLDKTFNSYIAQTDDDELEQSYDTLVFPLAY